MKDCKKKMIHICMGGSIVTIKAAFNQCFNSNFHSPSLEPQDWYTSEKIIQTNRGYSLFIFRINFLFWFVLRPKETFVETRNHSFYLSSNKKRHKCEISPLETKNWYTNEILTQFTWSFCPLIVAANFYYGFFSSFIWFEKTRI